MDEGKPVMMGYEGRQGEALASVGENLWAAHAAAARALEFGGGRSEEEYAGEAMVRVAVARMLELAAGALAELKRDAPESFARLECAEALLEVRGRLAAEEECAGEDGAVFGFVRGRLAELVGSLAAELEGWHGN